MMSQQIVLHFETQKGRYPNTEIAALALLDWVALLKAAIAVVDPHQQLEIEIAGVAPGSTRFPQILRFVDKQLGFVKSAWDDYPQLKSVIAGSAHTLFAAGVGGLVSLALLPDEQTVRLSDQDKALLERVGGAPQVQEASKRFYKTLERDPEIRGVGVADSWDARPSVIVPRSEFPERSGVWVMGAEDVAERTQGAVWDVVLLKPALISTPQSWQFMRDGLKFSAKMYDARFLEAIREGTVPLSLQEGVMMKVEIEYTERLNGQIWEPVQNSRRIVRVLSPSTRS